MNNNTAVIAVLALAAAFVWRGPVSDDDDETLIVDGIAVKAEYEVGEPIKISVEREDSHRVSVLWSVTAPAALLADGGTAYIWAPAGEYHVVANVVEVETTPASLEGRDVEIFEGVSQRIHRASFKVGDAPDPDPDDPPPPDPIEGPLTTIVIVRDPDTTTADQARELIKLRNHAQFARPPPAPQLMILDRQSKTSDGNPHPLLAKYPVTGAYPHYFLVLAGGQAHSSGDFVAADELIDQVNRLTD